MTGFSAVDLEESFEHVGEDLVINLNLGLSGMQLSLAATSLRHLRLTVVREEDGYFDGRAVWSLRYGRKWGVSV